VTTDHFAYAAFVYVGDTHEEGVWVGSKLLWFLHTSLKSAPQYSKFLPGAVPLQLAPQVYRTIPQPTAQPGESGGNGMGSAHAEAEKGIKLFAKEVLPRLREVAPVTVG
jgi:hypothetical protein